MKAQLTAAKLDAIVLDAAPAKYGAIVDADETTTTAIYFFESGDVARVNKLTGAVKFVR